MHVRHKGLIVCKDDFSIEYPIQIDMPLKQINQTKPSQKYQQK